jgi:hypothetical protein
VKTKRTLANSVSPGELTIGASSRGPRDAVIVLLKNLRMPFRQYLDPLAERLVSRVGDFRAPESELNLTGDRRRAPALPASVGTGRGGPGGLSAGAVGGERLGTPQQGAQWSPFRRPSAPPFVHAVPSGFQQAAGAPGFPPAVGRCFQPAAGMGYQQTFRPIPRAPVIPPMQQMAGGFAGPLQGQKGQDESVHYVGDSYGGRQMGGLGRGGNQNQINLQQREGSGVEPLEAQIAALESKHQMERLRGAMSSELRRMQSGVSPFEHPGVYFHVDQMVTIHELPRTWTGPLTVSATSESVLIIDNVKLAFLAEAIWEFTKRKCDEAGENLTEKQIMEIEAQTLEFYGKQRVEAKKFLEKARLNTGKTNK